MSVRFRASSFLVVFLGIAAALCATAGESCVLLDGQPYDDFEEALTAATNGSHLVLQKAVWPDGTDLKLGKDLTISAASEDLVAFRLRVIVEAKARVLFTNLTLTSVVDVGKGSVAAVGPNVHGLQLITSDQGGFELAGRLTDEIKVKRPQYAGVGDLIGVYSCSLEDAQDSAVRIVSWESPDLRAVPDGEGNLKWGLLPVDASMAEAAVDFGDGRISYERLDRLLENIVAPASVVVLKDCRLSKSYGLPCDVTFLSETGCTVTVAGAAGFAVTSGVQLVLSNLTFSAYDGDGSFLDVAGGRATLTDVTLTEMSSRGEARAGAITVRENGRVTIRGRSRIERCSATARGGGIRIVTGGTLDLQGGVVTNCVSGSAGGGIYVLGGTVRVSGNSSVRGNRGQHGNDGERADDVYLADESDKLRLAGELTGTVGICWNSDDLAFAIVEDGVAVAAVDRSCAFLVNDADCSLRAWPAADYATSRTLTWASERPVPTEPQQPEVFTNYPTPIAFKSIVRVSATEWRLVVTDRVAHCNYRLIFADDLARGLAVTGEWEQASAEASPEWTTNVVTTGKAGFWKAEAKEGVYSKE